MTHPKVSVIIPVYNTDKYLKAAFSSIQNQALRDIEIIVVNDGSTDRSEEIIENLAKSDKRIRYFSQLNSGQSVARNTGIDKATGEYLYFMDSDDLLEEDALEICYEKCTSQNLQIVTFDADIFSEDDKTQKWGFNYYRVDKIEGKVFNGIELMETLLEKDVFRASPCLIFVKRDLLEKIKLRFFPGIIHEDELFTPVLYIAADRIGYIPRTFFHRRIRANSTMTNNFSLKNIKGYFSVVEQLTQLFANKEKRIKAIADRLIVGIVNSVSYNAGSLPLIERLRVIKYFYKNGLINLVTFKNLVILLFPFTVKMKSTLLKARSRP